MKLDDTKRKELQEFVDKWKNEIPDEDIYFSFNGHGHLRYINANDEGLIRFAVKTIESALSHEKYTNLAGEYPSEDWIKQQDEDLSIHYIEKINQDIDKYILQREMYSMKGEATGNVFKRVLYAAFFGLLIYLIYYRVAH
jgi:hypothetical protein